MATSLGAAFSHIIYPARKKVNREVKMVFELRLKSWQGHILSMFIPANLTWSNWFTDPTLKTNVTSIVCLSTQQQYGYWLPHMGLLGIHQYHIFNDLGVNTSPPGSPYLMMKTKVIIIVWLCTQQQYGYLIRGYLAFTYIIYPMIQG